MYDQFKENDTVHEEKTTRIAPRLSDSHIYTEQNKSTKGDDKAV